VIYCPDIPLTALAPVETTLGKSPISAFHPSIPEGRLAGSDTFKYSLVEYDVFEFIAEDFFDL